MTHEGSRRFLGRRAAGAATDGETGDRRHPCEKKSNWEEEHHLISKGPNALGNSPTSGGQKNDAEGPTRSRIEGKGSNRSWVRFGGASKKGKPQPASRLGRKRKKKKRLEKRLPEEKGSQRLPFFLH